MWKPPRMSVPVRWVFLRAVLVVEYFYIDCTLFQEGLKMNNNETRYKKLLEVYKTAHPDLTKQVLFKRHKKNGIE